ncbi:uncharacterized protein BDW70DRAFT_169937 [Aspergillus foveolatus]|uniref:uncharacterized protein n=1 Tax=Aspergillus foveolatus TaxID=210207 RepID=UPI003CCD98B0
MAANDTCWDTDDRMACLRNVDVKQMNDAINATSARAWFPVIDGDITGKRYIKVPIILGASTDEGSKYMQEQNVTTEEEFVDLVASFKPQPYGVAPGIALPKILIRQLTEAYANVSSSPCDAAINANRHQACSTWSRGNISTYCYRFDVPLHDQNTAQQGNELPFASTPTKTWCLLPTISAAPGRASLLPLTRMPGDSRQPLLRAETPTWPKYAAGGQYAMMFRADGDSHVERDTSRVTPIRLVNGQPSGIAVACQR